MRGGWFKVYHDAAIHPKLKGLSAALHKGWFAVLCIAAKHDGAVPAAPELARWLSIRPYRAENLIDKLVAARLVDRDNDTLRIHNWEKWQSTPHQSARIDAENEPKAPKLVRPTGDKSRTYGPTDRQKEKGSAAARERSGRSTERPKSAARLKWETDFRKADPAGYARAIELEIFDADLVLADRITSAELREPGEGVRMAREALRQWAQVNRAPI